MVDVEPGRGSRETGHGRASGGGRQGGSRYGGDLRGNAAGPIGRETGATVFLEEDALHPVTASRTARRPMEFMRSIMVVITIRGPAALVS